MPSPEWTNEKAIPYQFTPMNTRQFRETLLPGTIVTKANSRESEIIVQNWESGMFQIGLRLLRFFRKHILRINEKQSGLRLEAVLIGEMDICGVTGRRAILLEGQYHLTDTTLYQLSVEKNTRCNYFVSYYPSELIRDFGLDNQVKPSPPRAMPERMVRLIQEAIHQPHHGIVKDIYYRKLVAELLYTHSYITTRIAFGTVGR